MKRLLPLFLLFFFIGTSLLHASEVPTISKDELKAQLDTGKTIVLDVRSGRDWSSSEFKIKGAIRAAGEDIAKWSKSYPKDQKLVLYCA